MRPCTPRHAAERQFVRHFARVYVQTRSLQSVVAVRFGRRTCECPELPRLDHPLSPIPHRRQPLLRRQQGPRELPHPTPQGHILINSDLEDNVPLIRASVEQLGFKFGDIKILLISHAHWDHDAASAMIKRLTGARYMVMDADVPVVESGGKSDFHYGSSPAPRYPPTQA